MQLLPGKTSLTILSFSALVVLLGTRKLAGPVDLDSVFDFRPRPVEARLEAPRRQASSKHIEVSAITSFWKGPSVKAATMRMDDPSGSITNLIEPRGSLDAFYRALSRTEAKQSVTRVLHYGDSPVTADSITADVRSLLQAEYGDAGHGFLLVAKPWAWYGHRGVDVRGSGWRIEPASQSRAKDGYHGLGGVSFRGDTGASSRIHLESAHNYIEVCFLRQPAGGSFLVSAGDQTLGQVNTDGPDKISDWAKLPLPEGTRDITITVQGSVRLFGTSFTKNVPGVIYSSLGLNGGQVQVVVRYFEQNHWAAQLQHERPDLVVINYGTNESMYPGYIETYYRQELREVIRRVKTAVPNASVLVMSPMDRGQPGRGGNTVPILPRIVEIQREAAAENDCAFFNTFEAMGGAGTMARWYMMQPMLVNADLTHPLPGGARRVGMLLDHALTSGYERFKSGRVGTLSEKRAPEPSDE